MSTSPTIEGHADLPTSSLGFPSATTTTSTVSQHSRPPKSPPLAFAKTPNDSLAPLTSHPLSPSGHSSSSNRPSPSLSSMGRTNREALLEATVEQQTHTISKLHSAFSAERDAWLLERSSLYERIASLESLLRSGKHDSPAKSPLASPTESNKQILSPQARAVVAAPSLPTITEDENITPLSARRDAAPRSIDLSFMGNERRRSVTFDGENGVEVTRISPQSFPARQNLSPPLPAANTYLAGHTPTKVPRPPTPPPRNMGFDGIEDTPTRHNTHLNNFLTQSNDSDEELKGPLHMPELPSKPEAGTFTLEALSKKLEQVSRNPEVARPGIYQHPSPGMVSPMDEIVNQFSRDLSPAHLPAAPPASQQPHRASADRVSEASSSKALSPGAAPGVLSPQDQHDAVHHEFEQGGIKLKKRPSVNFGLPLGTLGTLPAGARRHS